ncbi:head-tail adaptor protein [Xinfangfangia sp. CPCC 101601]|uniref:Head-tail adaptor protein n=1 Tax=Pseudogemmobacter lacusdianii TaxID=3069608 RepID=A0ABU0W109_9RHOB|nr:head-tail adaptor protein [Xinfangfangia sp. CPCC 101601]MDQ2067699.1 head-tail adaptor protein [Xinfangfangia sp. CPCC 101601]
MKVPHLNRALELQRAVQSPDGAGGFTTSWESLGTLWAEVRPGSGRDVAGEELVLTSTPYRITVRAAEVGAEARPQPGQRFLESSRVFAVLAVSERDPAGLYLTCFCREEAPQ